MARHVIAVLVHGDGCQPKHGIAIIGIALQYLFVQTFGLYKVLLLISEPGFAQSRGIGLLCTVRICGLVVVVTAAVVVVTVFAGTVAGLINAAGFVTVAVLWTGAGGSLMSVAA